MTTLRSMLYSRYDAAVATAKDATRIAVSAGLGAASTLDELAQDALDALVDRGWQTDAAAMPRRVVTRARAVPASLLGRAQRMADALQQEASERAAQAAARLGLPTPADGRALSQRVASLNATLDQFVSPR